MPIIWISVGKGFIGRYIARFAAEQGHRVFGIGHGLWSPEAAADWSYSHWSNGEIESANLSQLARVSGSPDTIYHLAGGSAVGASFENPQEDFTRTVETTARLLEWVRLNFAQAKVVAVSSAAVYGARHVGKISEDVPVTPFSPYGVHKAMMEALCQSYCANFDLRIAIVRLFSVYGARLEKQLIWDLCSKLAAASTVKLGGTGNEVRDWLHVSDAVNLLWLARQESVTGGAVINGGTGIGTRIADVAEFVRRAWGSSSTIEFDGGARRGDPSSLVADIARARTLGFHPIVDLEGGIRETVKWFKKTRSLTKRMASTVNGDGIGTAPLTSCLMSEFLRGTYSVDR